MFRKLCHALLFLGVFSLALPEPAHAHSSNTKRTNSSSKKSTSASGKKSTTQKRTSTTQKRRSSTSQNRRATPQKRSSTPNRAASTPRPDTIYLPNTDGQPFSHSAAVFLFDPVSGRTLYQKNADQRRPPASTQKLLTALIVAESGDLDKPVRVQRSDTLAEPVKLYMKVGEVYTRRQLLEALLVRSFNDVAVCLARDNAGSVEAFAAKMNYRAAQLGMNQSHFVNPNGLTAPGQLSTARDMAKLARAAYANPTIRRIVATKELTFHHPSGRVSKYKNTNRVLRGWPYCTGMKTGYTIASGHCLISSAEYNGRYVILVSLGNDRKIWQDSCSLLAWGLKQ